MQNKKKKRSALHTEKRRGRKGVCMSKEKRPAGVEQWQAAHREKERKPRGKQSPRRTCSTHSAPWHRQRTTRDDEMGSGRSSRARHLTRKEETEDDERGRNWADGRRRRRGSAGGRGERWEGGETPFRSRPSCCHHAPPAVMRAPHVAAAHPCGVACAR